MSFTHLLKKPHPFTGTVVIRYDPDLINIESYLEDMAASREISNVICKDGPGEISG